MLRLLYKCQTPYTFRSFSQLNTGTEPAEAVAKQQGRLLGLVTAVVANIINGGGDDSWRPYKKSKIKLLGGGGEGRGRRTDVP